MGEQTADGVAGAGDRSGCPFEFPSERVRPFDPPPMLYEIQASSRIERVRIWDGTEPWLLTGYDDVRAAFTDPRVSADCHHPAYPHDSAAVKLGRSRAKTFAHMDGEEHMRPRRMVAHDFTRRRAEELRGRIAEFTDELIQGMRQEGPPVDLVEAFALPLPSMMICELLGVPYELRHQFHLLSLAITSNGSTEDETRAAGMELFEMLAGIIELRTHEPADDIISRLVHEQLLTGELTLSELVLMCQILLGAGHETTAGMISLGMCLLLDNPSLFAAMAAIDDPTKLALAVDELLRYIDIAHLGRRKVAIEDIEIGGVVVRAGEGMILAQNIAGRDPLVFERPNEVVLDRDPNRHLAFGFGPHQCIGMSLARVTLQVAFKALLAAFPTMRWPEGERDVEFRSDGISYGIDRMTIGW